MKRLLIFIGQPIYSLKDTCLGNGTLEKLVIFGVQEGVLLKRGAWKSKIESPTASILWLSPLGMPFLTFIGQQYNLIRSNISQEALFAVSCVTRDMAPNYDWVARELFPNAYQVADKFHVVKNIIDQVQSVRIRYRQELLRKQRELEEASRKQPKLQPDPKIQRELKDLKKELSNGDTQLQLLQRSKGLLHKLPNEHTASQKLRARLLFRLFPDIKEAYKFSVALRKWYQRPMRNGTSITPSRHLLECKKKALLEIISNHLSSPCEEVKNIAHFMVKHIGEICNYFLGYKTNASAEALNQNLQRFIAINYGTRNSDFFLYRIAVHFS